MTPPQGSLAETALAFVRSRVPVVALVIVVALIARLATMPAPPERSAEAIAAMLGRAANGTVRAEDFVWEERGSFLHDALIGRRVLFLATHAEGKGSGTNDLYRAIVRLTRGGRPIAIGRIENLTDTPRGDERDLIAHGHHAAFATRVADAVSTITLLDLEGDLARIEAKTRSERARAYVENWLSTGAWVGLGRAELSFASPPKEAKFELSQDALVLALGAEGTPAAVGLSDETVNPGPRDEHGLRYQRLPHPVTPWPQFVADTARATMSAATAERARRGIGEALSFFASLRRSATPLPAELAASGGEETATAEGFPPPRLRREGTNAKEMPGEGAWMPAKGVRALSQSAAEAPAAFYETSIRPDATNPGAIVRLLVMDGRRFDLKPVPGTRAPRSETGLHGRGRVTEADLPLTVAAFVGGVPEGGASLGAVSEGQALIAPRPLAMTLAVDRFGHSALAAWPFGQEVPTNVRSLRQAGAPLVRAGKLEALTSEDAWLRERSALGKTATGHWVYAWGKDIAASTLGKALLLAGCADAIPLAAGPDPVGLAFLPALSAESKEAGEPHLLVSEMSWSTRVRSQGVWGSPHELVAVVERTMRPSAPLPEGSTWEPDAGKQPAPAWQPAVYTAKVTKLGVDVRLMLFSPGRFVLHVRAGSKEASHRFGGSFATTLEEAEKARLLASVGLGVVRRKALRGLATGGAIGLRFGPSAGALVVEGARARVELSESLTLSPEADAVELPLTANEGHPLPESRIVGSMRPRAALCVREDGSILLASTTFDTDEATTEALLDAGCGRVVALDRGSHSNASIARAGTENVPLTEPEQTTLFFLEGAFVAGGQLGADGLVTMVP